MLRGVGSAAVAVPLLDMMLDDHGVAYAGGEAIANRFGVLFFGNGTNWQDNCSADPDCDGDVPDDWTPTSTGEGFELSRFLLPLEAHRKRILMITGTDIDEALGGNDHHKGSTGIMSGAPCVGSDGGYTDYGSSPPSTMLHPTIDQRIAAYYDGETPFRSLEVGICPEYNDDEGSTIAHLSHNGPNDFNPAVFSPHLVYERLFGMSSDDLKIDRGRARISVLDMALDDIRRLQDKVGQRDKERLEAHFDRIRSLEDAIASSFSCEAPPTPPGAAPEGGSPDYENSEQRAEANRQMSELLAVALACDQTRVFTNQVLGSVARTVFDDLGADRNHHNLSHVDEGDAEKQAFDRAVLGDIFEWFMHLVADTVSIFENTPMGDGTLMDYTTLLVTSDCSNGNKHWNNNYPVLILGDAGGMLRQDIHLVGQGLDTPTQQVLLGLLQAVGLPQTSLGLLDEASGWDAGYVENPFTPMFA